MVLVRLVGGCDARWNETQLFMVLGRVEKGSAAHVRVPGHLVAVRLAMLLLCVCCYHTSSTSASDIANMVEVRE
jgi:hypothetical protein